MVDRAGGGLLAALPPELINLSASALTQCKYVQQLICARLKEAIYFLLTFKTHILNMKETGKMIFRNIKSCINFFLIFLQLFDRQKILFFTHLVLMRCILEKLG